MSFKILLPFIAIFTILNACQATFIHKTRQSEQLPSLSSQNVFVDEFSFENNQPTGSVQVKKLDQHLFGRQSDDFQSYTMFVTTNSSCNSNMFGWFFENLVNIYICFLQFLTIIINF